MPPNLLTNQLQGKPAEIPAPPARVVVGIPVDLMRRRPDIRAAEYNAMAQCAQIGVAKAELYPALSLLGTFGFLASDVGKILPGRHVQLARPQRLHGPVLNVEYL